MCPDALELVGSAPILELHEGQRVLTNTSSTHPWMHDANRARAGDVFMILIFGVKNIRRTEGDCSKRNGEKFTERWFSFQSGTKGVDDRAAIDQRGRDEGQKYSDAEQNGDEAEFGQADSGRHGHAGLRCDQT